MKIDDLKVLQYELTFSPTETITIELRHGCDGEKWAITKTGYAAFSKKHKAFVIEPIPSSRTDEYLDDTRFNTAQDALDFWENANALATN